MSIIQPIVRSLVLGAALTANVFGASAETNYPNDSVSIVVPFSAGGTTDSVARLVAEELQNRWGEAVVVENKPGAGTMIATQYVAKARPDGNTILFTDLALATNELTMASQPYDLDKDLRPAMLFADWPLAIVSSTSSGIKTLDDLKAQAAEKSISYGTFGPASSPHLGFELYKALTGADIKTLHFKGVSPVIQAITSGEVELSIMGAGAAASGVAKGDMNVVAIDYKSDLVPGVPTYAEAGLEGMRSVAWWGIAVPAGVSDEVVAEINAALNEALHSEKVHNFLVTNGYRPLGGAPEELTKRIEETISLYAPVVEKAGLGGN